jgi:hypothetical protein
MIDQIKAFLNKSNHDGLPLPMARDPKTGKGSVTVTSYWISFNLCIFCALMFIVSVVARLTGSFAPEAETQAAIQNAASFAFQLYVACGSFYLGRKFQGDGKTIDVQADKPDKDQG